MKSIWSIIKGLFARSPALPEKGVKHVFLPGQTEIARYGDFKVIGEWGMATQNENGEWVTTTKGNVVSETVKFVGYDGIMALGSDWIMQAMPEAPYRDGYENAPDDGDGANWWK